MRVQEIAMGVGSSRPVDANNLINSIAHLQEPPLSAPTTTNGTIDLSTPIITEATEEESGTHIEVLHTDII